MAKLPNSRANLDKAILRFTKFDATRTMSLKTMMADAIVAQMIDGGVIKGGSGLRFRFGTEATRMTMDLDAARSYDLDAFLNRLKARLEEGWNGFGGQIRLMPQAAPKEIPFEYVMQPCEVKLNYLTKPWTTVRLEIGHNELGDANEYDLVPIPEDVANLFTALSLPLPKPVPVMKLEFQVAQKLHGASAIGSKRVHDLIDLQLILSESNVDMADVADKCRRLFAYRKCQPWPTRIE
jgi:hypothetical protein